jgi:flagellar basal body-associated protein FliL
MANQPPSKKIGKNMIIALAVIAIVIIALVAGITIGLSTNQLTNTPTPTSTPTVTPTTTISFTPSPSFAIYDFKMSANHPSVNITQGRGSYVSINLETVSGNVQTVDPHDVVWSADSGSSGIEYDFDSTALLYLTTSNAVDSNGISIPDGFSNLLLITVPESTPTSNYAITITAKIGSVSHSISILVGVESSMVTVSGTVDPSYSHITTYQIEFWNLATDQKYIETLTQNYTTYSISVPNHEQYYVSVSDGTGEWYSCDGDFWLQVPAGSTAITKDFIVFGS